MRYRVRELDFNDGVNKPIYMAEASRGIFLPWHPIGQWEEAKLYSLMDIKRFKKEVAAENPHPYSQPKTKYHYVTDL